MAKREFKYKQCLVIRTDLGMSCGKQAVQIAHAALASYLISDGFKRIFWYGEGQRKVVLKVDCEEKILELEKLAQYLHISSAVIRDFELTQIKPNTITAIGLGPDTEENLNKITSHLSLL